MIRSNEIEAIMSEDYEEVITEDYPAEKKGLDLIFVQLCICIIIVGAVLILKELSPVTFETLKERYSYYIEQTLLMENGEIKIIDEKAIRESRNNTY